MASKRKSHPIKIASDDFLFPANNSLDDFAKDMTSFEFSRSLEEKVEEKRRDMMLAKEDIEQKRYFFFLNFFHFYINNRTTELII